MSADGADKNFNILSLWLDLDMMPDCDREGQIFLPTPHIHDRFLFLHTFHFWT